MIQLNDIYLVMKNSHESRKNYALYGLVIHSIVEDLNSLLNRENIDKIY